MKEVVELVAGPLVVLAGVAGGLGVCWVLLRLFPKLDTADGAEKAWNEREARGEKPDPFEPGGPMSGAW